MAAKIYRINYKSDFILTLNSDAGWMTPFCIKFWTGAPSQAFFVGWDGTTYTHCSYDPSEPTRLLVQFDDHHLPIGDLKFQIAYHFTVADFPNDTEDEVINPANITTEIDGHEYQVMLDFTGETAPEIQFSLPAYANEAQRIANEQQRIANEEQRIADEQTRIDNEALRISAEQTRQDNEAQRIRNEQTRISQEEARVREFATLKHDAQEATASANDAAALANQKAQLAADKAQLAADKAALAQDAANLANQKAQLAADKAALANDAAALANEKAALAQQKAEYAQTQGDYAKQQGDYAKEQGDYAKRKGDDAAAQMQQQAQAFSEAQAARQTAYEQAEGTESGSVAGDGSRWGAFKTNEAARDAKVDAKVADITNLQKAVAEGAVYDISANNSGATYADLTAALGTDGANVPVDKRKGGMSIKFIQSSDNKYVQYRYMPDDATVVADFTNVANWQGVDEEPIANSKNLITSGAVHNLQEQVEDNTEEIEKKANKDGYYETLGAGTASNLRGQNTIEQQISYRPSGGNLDIATGAASIDSIKGKTVKFNQKVSKDGAYTRGDLRNGYWVNGFFVCESLTGSHRYNRRIDFSPEGHTVVGHKYYGVQKCLATTSIASKLQYSNDRDITEVTAIKRTIVRKSGIVTATNWADFVLIKLYYYTYTGTEFRYAFQYASVVDLTELFGEGNEPTTAAQFEQWCEDNLGDSEYFDYDDGSLLPVKLDSLKTVGFNQYSPSNPVIRRIKNQQYQITGTYTDVWESWLSSEPTFNSFTYGDEVDILNYYLINGKRYLSMTIVNAYNNTYVYAVGDCCIYNNQVYECNTRIETAEEFDSSKWTLIPDFAAMVNEGIFTMVSITPDANGIFTPTERYIHVEGGNGTDTCVHLVGSGSRNGDYEPYKENTKALPITTMQGRLNGTGELVTIFPDGLKSVDSVYDEIKVENGVVKAIKRVGSVDMGTLSYLRQTPFQNLPSIFVSGVFGQKHSGYGLIYNYTCKTSITTYSFVNDSNDKEFSFCGFATHKQLCIRDDSYTDAATFKAAMNGVMLYYELETPLEYVVDGFEMPAQYLVDDWGTEMTIPQNDGGEVTALATLGIRYGVNAVDQLRRIPQTTITSESMDNFLIALGAQMGGTWTKTWNSETNKYDFTFTANPEPEEEVEP